MKSAEKVVPLRPAAPRRNRDEIAFLPAALEVVETPPSPVGRAIAATIIAAFCLALAWAAIGKVDIVASARGRIIPSGRSKVVQPLETAVVRAIHVHDGERVRAGQTLIELDPTVSTADVNRNKSELIAAELQQARLQAILANPNDPLGAFQPPPGAPPALVATQRKFLIEQTAAEHAKIADLDQQIAQKKADWATISAQIAKIKASIPILEELVGIRKKLLAEKWTSKLQYLQAELKLVGQQREVDVQKSHLQGADAAVAALTQTRATTVAKFRRTVLQDLAAAQEKVAVSIQDVIKAERRSALQSLTAPIDGVVQELAVHTIGGVVTPAERLLVIVPSNEKLRVKAMVENRDIGFVHAGQKAVIKVDTFNYTRYGLLHGTVLDVSRDAVVRNRPARQSPPASQLGAENGSSEPVGQQLAYSTFVSLDRSQMRVGDKLINLGPGMAVTVEIKTGERTILSYLLSPLSRLKDEAFEGR